MIAYFRTTQGLAAVPVHNPDPTLALVEAYQVAAEYKAVPTSPVLIAITGGKQ